MIYYILKKKNKNKKQPPSQGSIQYKENKDKCTKPTWQEGSRWNMFKALANVTGQMQKEIKSSNFSPAKHKLKNWFCFLKSTVQPLPADTSHKPHDFSRDKLFKGEVPRTIVWPHLFQSRFYFHFQLYAWGKEARSAQNNRS